MENKYLEYIDKVKSNINSLLNDQIEGLELLNNSVKHHFRQHGKMLRPLIMLLISEDMNGREDLVLKFSTSLELIHNYSLIHDDLPAMDNDDYRRGNLTVHKKFGQAAAILTGDYLLTKAFENVTDINDIVIENPIKYIEAINELALNSNSKGMLGGQFKDLNTNYISDYSKLLSMYEDKTSALFKSAFKIPGILMGKSKDFIDGLDKIGSLFGIYFQIKDDISDRQKDMGIGKVTIFTFMTEDDINIKLESIYRDLLIELDKLELAKTKELIVGLYEK